MVKIIVGLMGSSVASGSSKLASPEQLRPLLSLLPSFKVNELDTARVYNGGKSEELLGLVTDSLHEHNFLTATKAPGFSPGSLTAANILKDCKASLAALKQDKVDLYYLHGPDRQTPLEETCRAINQLHVEGKFNRFGVSNFRADEVEEIVSICHRNGWVAPAVYQGGYNPISRTMESKLLPTLRKHRIAFYAYSPLAGGYFTRPIEQLRSPPAGGRMDQMKVFASIYVNDLSLQLHDTLHQVCEKEGLEMYEACLRWLVHHSPLEENDGIILGGSSQEQFLQSLKACRSPPLPSSVVNCFEDMWKRYSETEEPAYCV